MQEIDLNFYGPYSLANGEKEILADCPFKNNKGIYLWLLNINNKNYISYLGKTSRSFYVRTTEHILHQLSGVYSIKEPKQLKKGIVNNIWDGMYGKPNNNDVKVFIERYIELAPINIELIKMYKILIAPFENQLTDIEGAIAREIKSKEEYCKFLDKGIKFPKLQAHQEQTIINIKSPIVVEGLNEKIKI